MIHRYSLFSYLLIIILISSSIVLGLVILGNRNLMSRVLFSSQEEKFRFLTKTASAELELRLSSVEEAIKRNGLLFMEAENRPREKSIGILTQTLGAFPSIFAMEIIFAENEKDQMERNGFQAIYAWRDNSNRSIKVDDRSDPATDYQSEWFTRPVEKKESVWSSPYYDPQINVLMITYSVPVFNVNGEIEAIMTADVSLEWLDRLLDTLPIGTSGEPILITSDHVIYRSESKGNYDESLLKLARDKTDPENQKTYANLIECLKKSDAGQIRFCRATKKEDSWLYFSTLPKIGWKLGCVIPESEIFGIVRKMNHRIVFFGICGILLLIFPSFWIARSVAHPLWQLSRCAHEVADGRFDAELPMMSGNGEIPKLFCAFDSMRGDLKRYIHDLTESTKAEERLHSQLLVARSIQTDMVPKNFDVAAKGKIDLYAMMKPAQEVGGDLYDFAVLDEDHFYFCVGDVSGKGIPASLFMAVGKTLIRSAIQTDRDPAKALTRVNKELMENNKAGLFITALCGIYHMDSRELEIACAGHNPPFLLGNDGHPKMIKDDNAQFPLAIMDDVEYSKFMIPIASGETFFLYTDGVTDAVNPADDFFGETNLVDRLTNIPKNDVKTLVEAMMREIEIFADGAKQSDDITILAFRQNLS